TAGKMLTFYSGRARDTRIAVPARPERRAHAHGLHSISMTRSLRPWRKHFLVRILGWPTPPRRMKVRSEAAPWLRRRKLLYPPADRVPARTKPNQMKRARPIPQGPQGPQAPQRPQGTQGLR